MDRASFAFAGAPAPDELAELPRNDWGNAMRFVRTAGGVILDDGSVDCSASELLFVREQGWVGWDGRVWDFELGPRLAERLAHKVALALSGQVPAMLSRQANPKEVWDFVRKSGDAGRLRDMLRVAEGYLQASLSYFDRDPLRFNVKNGTLRFRREPGEGFKLELLPHDLRDRITRIADVDYNPTAECKLWRTSLDQWLPDKDVREFMRRLMGYVLTGLTAEQVFVILLGRGRDGKSTFVGVLRELFGGYADVADARTFLDTGQRNGGEASPDLARLAGDTRLVSVAEPPRGAKLGEAMIKSFTGGAPIVARRLRRDPFSFEPKPKVIMETNSRPRITGDDDGIWRRIRLVVFTQQVPLNQVDHTLSARLRNERSGILNWLFQGVAEYLSDGLGDAPQIAAAMDDYRMSSSPFAEWFEECVELDPHAVTPYSYFRASFGDWCTAQELDKPMSQVAFANALTDRLIMRAGQDSNGRARRRGARLRTSGS
jgi:putative DNA primase/helicase